MAMIVLGNQGELALSPAQFEVMCKLYEGKTITAVAAELCLAYATVYSHYDAAKAKLGTETQAETLREFQKHYRESEELIVSAMHLLWGQRGPGYVTSFFVENILAVLADQAEFNLLMNNLFGMLYKNSKKSSSLNMMLCLLFCVILLASYDISYAGTPTPVVYGTPWVTPTSVVNALPNVAIAQANLFLPDAGATVMIVVVGIAIFGRVALYVRKLGRRGRRL